MKKALFVKVEGELEVWEFSPEQEYDAIKQAVGGWIEGVDLPTQNARLWVNEEGKLNGLPVNPNATLLWETNYGATDVIVGNVLITGGIDDNGDTVSLTDEQIVSIFNLF